MKHLLKTLLVVFILSFLNANLFAVEATVDSLSNQLYNTSNRYSENGTIYRVILNEKIQQYFKDIKAIDTDKSEMISESALVIQELKDKNAEQQLAYVDLNEKYEYAIKANDAMEFFTLLIPKSQYNLMMWGLVVALAALGVILLLMFKRGHQVTKQAKKELDEVREEYDAYRKRALKREQEVAAGYQRDINRLKGVV